MTGSIEMDRAIPARKKPEWSFYFIWVSWTTLCIPVGYALSFIPLSIIILFIGDYIYVNGVQRKRTKGERNHDDYSTPSISFRSLRTLWPVLWPGPKDYDLKGTTELNDSRIRAM
jgi:hypothetical protein